MSKDLASADTNRVKFCSFHKSCASASAYKHIRHSVCLQMGEEPEIICAFRKICIRKHGPLRKLHGSYYCTHQHSFLMRVVQAAPLKTNRFALLAFAYIEYCQQKQSDGSVARHADCVSVNTKRFVPRIQK